MLFPMVSTYFMLLASVAPKSSPFPLVVSFVLLVVEPAAMVPL